MDGKGVSADDATEGLTSLGKVEVVKFVSQVGRRFFEIRVKEVLTPS